MQGNNHIYLWGKGVKLKSGGTPHPTIGRHNIATKNPTEREKISEVEPKQSKFFYIVSNVNATTNKHHFTSKHTK